jgi:hypothetical protein
LLESVVLNGAGGAIDGQDMDQELDVFAILVAPWHIAQCCGKGVRQGIALPFRRSRYISDVRPERFGSSQDLYPGAEQDYSWRLSDVRSGEAVIRRARYTSTGLENKLKAIPILTNAVLKKSKSTANNSHLATQSNFFKYSLVNILSGKSRSFMSE